MHIIHLPPIIKFILIYPVNTTVIQNNGHNDLKITYFRFNIL